MPTDTLITAEQPPARPPAGEVATTRNGRDITRGYIPDGQRLPPQDSILQARGAGNLAIYDEVLRDEQVKMALDQRRLAVISCDWEVEPASDAAIDQKAADALKENLESIEFDRISDQMLWGVFYGYAVAECLYVRDGAQVMLDDIKVRDRRRFAFDGAQQLRLLTNTNAAVGELLPPAKFWRFCTGATHGDEPYGLGLAHWLYWPVWFKRNGIQLWLQFLDKFGAPTVVGKYPPNATAEERAKLLEACAAIRTDSGVVIPEGMLVELLEAGRSGTADYSALHDKMNDAIAKVALGQVMTSEAKGGQYKSEIQMDVRQDLVKADADLVCMSFSRQVAKWLTAWNFPAAQPPRVWRMVDEGEDLNQAAERDAKIFSIGFRPTLERIEETYGEGYEPVTPAQPAADVVPAKPAPERVNPGAGTQDKPVVPAQAGVQDGGDATDLAEAARTFPDQAAVDAAIESIPPATEQAQVEPAIAPIIALIESGASYADILGKLADRWPAMDSTDLEEALSRAWFAFETFGRLTAKAGA